jgi:hypothetical protein
VGSRFKLWDLGVVLAFVLTLVGMFLAWWSFNPTAFFGLSADVSGWSAPTSGVGIAAVVASLVAMAFACLKSLFPAGTPLPAWYKEGWVVGTIGLLCTVLGIIACLRAPRGGFAIWSWRPGSLLVLLGGLIQFAAGLALGRDQPGGPQLPTPRPLSPQQAPGTASHCSSCGTAVPHDAAFCPACGRRV